ncbi:MAG: YunC family protein [Kiritimatiellae bacterium]|nr:YunC family protein [Kiritimatiellia bacterium]
METLAIDGHDFRADEIPVMGSTKLLLIQGLRGMLGCGYVSLGAAEKFGHALAIVKGVASFDDMLAAKVCEVSPAAAALGVKAGMTGREALLLMA